MKGCHLLYLLVGAVSVSSGELPSGDTGVCELGDVLVERTGVGMSLKVCDASTDLGAATRIPTTPSSTATSMVLRMVAN